jgi:acyl-homoserine lactone acylase PvdQ
MADSNGSKPSGSTAPKFSHAWVGDGRFTNTGSAVLVSMPQTNVANPSLFYEFHICGKTLDARGIGVAGSPIILIGWNRNVAWGMTALGADQADLFRLKTDPDQPGQYVFDGQWRPLQTRDEVIQVKNARPQHLTVRETHLGPVVNEFAFARPDEPLVALKRIPICDSGHDTIVGALGMMRARSVKQFMAALEHWRFPTANVLVGDRDGSIAYSAIGALPLRSPLALEGGGAAHDGSASKSDWQTMIPQDLLPHVVDPERGFLFSGNHRPVGSFYPIPIGVRTGSMGDSVRSWRLRQLFAGKTSMSPQQLLDMFRDTTNPARRAIAGIGYHLRDRLQVTLNEETRLALKHLENWYGRGAPSRLDVAGAELALLINTQFRFVNSNLAFVYGGGESGLSHFLKTVAKRIDRDRDAEITQLERAYIERLLANAWQTAKQQWGENPGEWNARARQEAGDNWLAYFGSLDGFPSIDVDRDLPMPALRCTDRATIFSQAGQAYVQWVPLGNVDQARSLLPPGQTEQRGSAYRTINVESWVNGELHPAPLSRDALEPYIATRKSLPSPPG